MRHVPRTHALALTILVGLALISLSACDSRREFSLPPWTGDVGFDLPDVDVDGDAQSPESLVPAPADICEAGEVRCVARATGTIEECRVPAGSNTVATRWVASECPAGQVCIDGSCGSFSCEPGRLACEGLSHSGVCAADGRSVQDVEPCPSPTVCRGGACVDLCESARRAKSYIGCEYMLVELPNELMVEGTPDAPFGVVVANESDVHEVRLNVTTALGTVERILSSVVVSSIHVDEPPITVHSEIKNERGVVISDPGGPAQDLIVPAGGTAQLLFGRAMVPSGASGVFPLARRLTASRPVVAYQFNPFCCNTSFSNDASLLLPISGLGNDYAVNGAPDWVLAESGVFAGAGLTVVAHTETEVTIEEGAQTVFSGRIGQSTVVLNAGDVLYLESAADGVSRLEGTRVRASETVAAFATHICTFIPHTLAACDHLEQQLIPEDTWGRTYLLAPAVRRGTAPTEVTYFRVSAGDAETVVNLGDTLDEIGAVPPFGPRVTDCRDVLAPGPARTLTLPANESCMFGSQRAVSLDADRPVSVVGFISGEEAAGGGAGQTSTGDPSMFLLPPAEQYRSSYIFLSPSSYAFNYMTLLLPSVPAAAALTFDGLPLNVHDHGNVFEIVEGDQLIVHVPVEPGVHRISSTRPFGLLVYAYDRYVSFAYTGGLNLTKRP